MILSSDEEDSSSDDDVALVELAAAKKRVAAAAAAKQKKATGSAAGRKRKKAEPSSTSSPKRKSASRAKQGKKANAKTIGSKELAAMSVAQIMKGIIALGKERSRAAENVPTLAELGYTDVHEVTEMDTSRVTAAIEKLVGEIALSILSGKGVSYKLPSRTAKDQIYVKELDRIVLRRATKTMDFKSHSSVKKTTILTRVVDLLYQVLKKDIHVTKRDLFYTDVKLFVDQKSSDGVLDDCACMLGCTRTNLHVIASAKGIVVGRLSFREAGDLIDCTRMGIGGKAIPPHVDQITDIRARQSSSSSSRRTPPFSASAKIAFTIAGLPSSSQPKASLMLRRGSFCERSRRL